MNKRHCAAPGCTNELRMGQRCVYGSRESARQFELRKYCSYRCQVRAQASRVKTYQKRLQDAWDACPDLMEVAIVFHGRRGWIAEPMEIRWFGDEGEYLGARFDDAMVAIHDIAGLATW